MLLWKAFAFGKTVDGGPLAVVDKSALYMFPNTVLDLYLDFHSVNATVEGF